MEECASYLKPTSAFKSHEKEGKEILNKVRQEHVRAAGRPSFGFPRQVDHYDTVYVLSPNEHQKEELRTSGLKFGRESPKDIFSVTKDPSAEDLSTPRRGSRSPSVVGSLPLTSESAQKSCDSGSMQATRPTTAPAANATRATMIRKELFREPNSFSSISSPKESGSTTAAAGVGVKKTEESPPSSILPTVKQQKQSTKLNPTADSVGTERLPRPSTAPSPVKQKSGDVSLPKVVAPASSSANTSTKPAESIATPSLLAAGSTSTSAAPSSAKHEDRPQGEPGPSAALNERPSAEPPTTNETMDDEASQKSWVDKAKSGSDAETANETTQRDGQVLDEPTTGHGVEADADLDDGCQPVDLHGAEEKVEDIRGEIAEITEIIAALNRDLVANVTNAAMASFHIATALTQEAPDETSASSSKINANPSTAAVHEAEASVIQWDPREFMQRIENCVKDIVACAVDDAQLAVLALKQRKREVAAQAASESKKRLLAERANRPQPQAPTEDPNQTTAAVTEAVGADPAPAVAVEENAKQSSEPSENSEQLQDRSNGIATEAKEPSVVKDVPVGAVSTAHAPEVVTIASDSRELDVAPVGTVFDSFLSRYLHPPTETAAVAGPVEASMTSDGSPQRQKTKKSKAKAKAKEKKSAKKPAAVAPHRPPQDFFSDDSSDDDRGSGHEEDYDGDGDVTHGDGRHERVTGQRRKKVPHICACDVCAMLKREKHVLKNMYMTWREVRRMHRATRRGAPVPSLPADDASDAIPLPPDQLLGLCLSEMVKFSAESHRLLQSCQRSFVGPKASEQHAPFQCDKVSKDAPAPADG